MNVLVIAEHDRGTLAPATLEALAAARPLGTVHVATLGDSADGLADVLASHGAAQVHQVHHPLLADYGPEAWGDAVAQLVWSLNPEVVLSCGTDRGNEVLAHLAAITDLPFVANCLDIRPGDATWSITRVRWGGSLLEECELSAGRKLVSVGHHAFEASEAPVSASTAVFTPELDESVARTVVTERVERAAGVTLATSPVVVGGGRGVGSPDGFAPLEELAGLLGGVVGCSRAVTNNGWRNHTDQVGQTGTRIAPDLYFACGISGAIQHWVGAMASKKILAINTDPEANMVTKADYAVIGDLHQVIPAISAEIRRRRG
ncbi:MAG: electron transfer flavoprotein subunit alpha/FixB family protein [Actinomycetota bacterium]